MRTYCPNWIKTSSDMRVDCSTRFWPNIGCNGRRHDLRLFDDGDPHCFVLVQDAGGSAIDGAIRRAVRPESVHCESH